jgi:hypothetical protein
VTAERRPKIAGRQASPVHIIYGFTRTDNGGAITATIASGYSSIGSSRNRVKRCGRGIAASASLQGR